MTVPTAIGTPLAPVLCRDGVDGCRGRRSWWVRSRRTARKYGMAWR